MKKNNMTMTETRNVDFFCANRELSDRVSEFFRCVLRKKEINLEYSNKITELQNSIENLEKLAGSIMADQIPALKQAAYDQLQTFESDRKKLIDEQATFEYTQADKDFKKAMSKNPAADEVMEEVGKWFDNYGLNVRDTFFMEEVCGTFGMKIDYKTIVNTDGKRTLKVDSNNVLKNLYACAYEHMVAVGTIKANQIPELVRKAYMPKKVNKKNK